MRYAITFIHRFAAEARAMLRRIWRTAWRRFQRLAPTKRYTLYAMAGLGALVIIAALVYCAIPAPNDTLTHHTTSAASATAIPYTGPTVAGQYTAQTNTRGDSMIFDLHQYGPDLTGSYTSVTCGAASPQFASGLVTGHVLTNGDLSLTFSTPNQPHSTTIVFHLTTSASGLDLAWRDSAGEAKSQHWSPATTATITQATSSAACGK